jgi:hypothetical protein
MDLFNNPMINRAREALSDEDKQRYSELGKAMFSVDFTSDTYDLSTSMANAVEYIQSAIFSGQHPSTLEQHEKDIMTEIQGENWVERYGYTSEDIDSIVTIPPAPITYSAKTEDSATIEENSSADETKE